MLIITFSVIHVDCGGKNVYMFKNTVKAVSWGSSIVLFVIQYNHNDLISTFVMQNCCLKLYVKQILIRQIMLFFFFCDLTHYSRPNSK